MTGATDEPRRLATKDVARLLGISRQRVDQLVATDPTFPRSGGRRRDGGRFWHRAGIEVWAAQSRPGRIHPNPMAGVVATLVHHARAFSDTLGFRLVESEMFWLGSWEPALPGGVRAVLETMGVTREIVARTLERQYGSGRSFEPTMSPKVQMDLEAMLRRAREAGRAEPTEFDVAIVLVEAELRGIAEARPRGETNWFGGRQGDALLMALERRGLEPVELRDRLQFAEVSPRSLETFHQLRLKRAPARRRGPRPRPPWLPELAKNPLGHDPWERGGWGSVFFLTPDGRGYTVDGYQWFFHVDGDGFPVRTVDGRPVGYRWQVDPPAPHMVRQFEALPMPPDPVGNWPDYRSRR